MGSASGGVWLSQILYWDKVKAGDWFYKSARDIIGETGITERESKRGKAQAIKLGIVDCQVKGMPRVSHYLVNYERLSSLLEATIETHCEASNKSATSVQLEGRQCPTNEPPVSDYLVQSPIQNGPQITTETTSKTTTENKHTYGPFNNVLLTETEFGKLRERFGAKEAQERIADLSHGIASKGYKYKSHYATILNWARRDGIDAPATKGPTVQEVRASNRQNERGTLIRQKVKEHNAIGKYPNMDEIRAEVDRSLEAKYGPDWREGT